MGELRGREQPGQFVGERPASTGSRIDGDQGDEGFGNELAVGHDALGEDEAGAASAVRPGEDGQPIALVGRAAKVELEAHHDDDGAQFEEAIVGEGVPVVPLLAAPLEVFDVLGVVDVAVDVDLGGTDDDVERDFDGEAPFDEETGKAALGPAPRLWRRGPEGTSRNTGARKDASGSSVPQSAQSQARSASEGSTCIEASRSLACASGLFLPSLGGDGPGVCEKALESCGQKIPVGLL
jgi:hypothetical protein